MMDVRGYSITNAQDEFKYFLFEAEKNGNMLTVFGNFTEKLSVGAVKECLAFLVERGSAHCVIIYVDGITPLVNKLVENSVPIRIELFKQSELGYNVTKHVLVPVHSLASAEERQQLVKYAGKLPCITSADPVVRFLGFNRGDYVKIVRKDRTVAFRMVV